MGWVGEVEAGSDGTHLSRFRSHSSNGDAGHGAFAPECRGQDDPRRFMADARRPV